MLNGQDLGAQPAVDLTSGYIQRAAAYLPKQGLHKPWIYHQNYVVDLAAFKLASLNAGAMQFERRRTVVAEKRTG